MFKVGDRYVVRDRLGIRAVATVVRVTPKGTRMDVKNEMLNGVTYRTVDMIHNVLPSTDEEVAVAMKSLEEQRASAKQRNEEREKYAAREDVNLARDISNFFSVVPESQVLALGLDKLRQIKTLVGI